MKKPQKLNSLTKGWEKYLSKGIAPIVKVTWVDACSNAREVIEPEELANYGSNHLGAIMQDIGFLVYSNLDWVVLAADCHAERAGGYRRIMQIPQYSICEIKVLEDEEGVLKKKVVKTK